LGWALDKLFCIWSHFLASLLFSYRLLIPERKIQKIRKYS
jgi:hypothetical protein